MSSHNLEYLLAPQSLAVIGASDRAGSVGETVMRNVMNGGFRGPVWPVNLRRELVAGVRAYATPTQLPAAPDLAVICTPAASSAAARIAIAGTFRETSPKVLPDIRAPLKSPAGSRQVRS